MAAGVRVLIGKVLWWGHLARSRFPGCGNVIMAPGQPGDYRGVHTTLLGVLRDRGLTGATESCAQGDCGAGTGGMMADEAGGGAYRAVNICLSLAPMAASSEILA